ncbi:double-stranded RNA-binding protein Staufen2-like [Tropilaelaps mercedesae]|uniref:Double-stranded RNA-binding protein Staufen2-like n=1 Tax=Tropilaelaps mercedesae TaxID=418985 RepID=A0A1V9Y0L7_9ACAR|nr:double-stranded RNA-binding protein Staufen2-like [Tropilaelaps mercedesae]
MKRGEPAIYRVVEIPRLPSAYLSSPLGYHRTSCTGPAALYGPHGVHSLSHPGHGRYHPHFPPRLAPSYRAILDVGERKFIGEGNTEQAARHSAAEVALATLRSLPLPASVGRRSVALSDDEDDEGKSAISVVYEMALKRNLQVDFEVVSESGPPHMRKYVTRCQVGTVATTEGCGNGKKLSKKEAAEKMVAELRKLGPVAPPAQGGQTAGQQALTAQKRQLGGPGESGAPAAEKKKASSKKKGKNLIKEQRPDGTCYGQGINPISRLIQIQQAKKEKEPAYSVIAERGEPRSREFVIQCSLDGGASVTQGTGPNKKTAKRKAAEAMLQQLGYAKPAAQQAGSNNKEGRENVDTSNMNETPNSGRSGQSRQITPGLFVISKSGKESKNDRTRGKGAPPDRQAAIAKELLDGEVSLTAMHLGNQGTGCGVDQSANRQTSAMAAGANSGGTQGSLIKAKDQLSYLAQVLGIQVSFMNFPKGSEYLSLVALTSNPPQQCHGSGRTVEEAQDNAAHSILVTLAQLGIDSIQASNNNNNNNNSGKNSEGNKAVATTTA